jgi:hypothetical protein
MPVLFALGVAGSLLPDIDLERSRPTNCCSTSWAVVLAFAVTLPLTVRFQPLVLAAIWGTVFLCVRYGVFEGLFELHRPSRDLALLAGRRRRVDGDDQSRLLGVASTRPSVPGSRV